MRLNRLLPGVFWFWLANVLLFEVLFKQRLRIAGSAARATWFSVINLFMISGVLDADVGAVFRFAGHASVCIDRRRRRSAPSQALVVRLAVSALGLDGMLIIAAGGFLAVIVLRCIC